MALLTAGPRLLGSDSSDFGLRLDGIAAASVLLKFSATSDGHT